MLCDAEIIHHQSSIFVILIPILSSNPVPSNSQSLERNCSESLCCSVCQSLLFLSHFCFFSIQASSFLTFLDLCVCLFLSLSLSLCLSHSLSLSVCLSLSLSLSLSLPIYLSLFLSFFTYNMCVCMKHNGSFCDKSSSSYKTEEK